jgi:plasmid stabilization system protein ParE
MKIVFLASAELDLRWYRHYYEDVFPEGRKRANSRYLGARRAQTANPYLGTLQEDGQSRKFTVTGTPFHFVYRVGKDRIEILRVKDGRSNPFDTADASEGSL